VARNGQEPKQLPASLINLRSDGHGRVGTGHASLAGAQKLTEISQVYPDQAVVLRGARMSSTPMSSPCSTPAGPRKLTNIAFATNRPGKDDATQ